MKDGLVGRWMAAVRENVCRAVRHKEGCVFGRYSNRFVLAGGVRAGVCG